MIITDNKNNAIAGDEVIFEGKVLGSNEISLDMKKFKKIRIYALMHNSAVEVYEMDISYECPFFEGQEYTIYNSHTSGGVRSSGLSFQSRCAISKNKDKFKVITFIYFENGTNPKSADNNPEYYVYKIEGII